MVIDGLLEAQRGQPESEKVQGGPDIERFPQYCEIYLQELNQIPRINFRETSLHASSRGKRKEPL